MSGYREDRGDSEWEDVSIKKGGIVKGNTTF